MSNLKGAQYAGLIAAHDAAQIALQNYQDFVIHHRHGNTYDPDLARKEIAFLEAKLALADGSVAYNRSAKDLEATRHFIELELQIARDGLAKLEAQVPPPPKAKGADAISGHLDRNELIRALDVERRPIIERLAIAFQEVERQMVEIRSARLADKLPAPVAVLDFRLLHQSGYMYADNRPLVPCSSENCTRYLESIAASRLPNPRNGMSAAEAQIYDLRNGLAAYEQRQADEREKSEAVADGTDKQASICGQSVKAYKRDRDARKAAE